MDRQALAALARDNRGVATRAELDSVGISAGAIADRVKSGEWQRAFRGVYLLTSGVASVEQRLLSVQKWAGNVAVFSHHTAAFLHGLRPDLPAVVEVSVPPTVGLRSTERCRVWRPRTPITRVGSPPRTSLEQTAVDLLDGAASESAVLEILTTAFQRGMVPARFLKELARHGRVRHRGFAVQVTELTEEGVESRLEAGYRKRVEQAHGLQRSVRQKWERIRGRWIRSDCWYPEFGVRTELDGELAHPGRASDDDVVRDNDVRLALNEITVRYRWTHVWNAPCLAAGQVTVAPWGGGWPETPTRCSLQCQVLDIAGALTTPAA
ncbi:MAG: type IV toxin-antitoxin system AbiEi family antitoxin domain-containing protein [Tessaracoccus sp.]|uniref:type IV toxin-antitoxin system AbiEi family antitoxin domain-containing protein n=1 Tax=Tessaracoccus sp. TaxID=1971211 RepID=UPI001EC52071|nr:type IV toxin-antitoxin system AbiEi family antitoxin domain-containing protein [Tessaracoccus sp.]MBK7821862.1 type IV toxin-antitoxin system AbiEi family antitoxin domain-containing protein [Tessaracoccus sp.]